jgi:hypothetical protein
MYGLDDDSESGSSYYSSNLVLDIPTPPTKPPDPGDPDHNPKKAKWFIQVWFCNTKAEL